MNSVLEEIILTRRGEIEKEKGKLPLGELQERIESSEDSWSVPQFFDKFVPGKPFLIAEIKKASPSKGIIREECDSRDIASIYGRSNLVSAISILTEPDYFLGAYENIVCAREELISLNDSNAMKPILMKDFIIDEYQIYKGKSLGASSILLIAAVLSDKEIESFMHRASLLGLEVLLEVHSVEEMKRAVNLGAKLVGINNRDLTTFETHYSHTLDILKKVPVSKNTRVISESGLSHPKNLKELWDSGVHGFLIGETFMASENIEDSIEEIMSEIP